MRQAGTTRSSERRDEFLFVGNQLFLDFLNTRPVQNHGPIELLPDFSALLRWFRATDLLSPRDAATLQRRWGRSGRSHRVLQAFREVREKLRNELLAWQGGRVIHHSTVNQLNGLMAKYPMRTRLKAAGGRSSAEQWFEAGKPEDLFAPLAQSAAALFANADRSRIRKCDHCVLHFHDTSKKGTRRWCSMQLCGNRLKVAAYAARRRARV